METYVYISEMESDEKIMFITLESDDYHIFANDGMVQLFYKNKLKYQWDANNEMCGIQITISSMKKYYSYEQYFNDYDLYDDNENHSDVDDELVPKWQYHEYTYDNPKDEFITFKYNQFKSKLMRLVSNE